MLGADHSKKDLANSLRTNSASHFEQVGLGFTIFCQAHCCDISAPYGDTQQQQQQLQSASWCSTADLCCDARSKAKSLPNKRLYMLVSCLLPWPFHSIFGVLQASSGLLLVRCLHSLPRSRRPVLLRPTSRLKSTSETRMLAMYANDASSGPVLLPYFWVKSICAIHRHCCQCMRSCQHHYGALLHTQLLLLCL